MENTNKHGFTKSGFLLGLDPPATRDIGWALFKFDCDTNTASYYNSGSFDIKGNTGDKSRLTNLKDFLIKLNDKHNPILVYCIERAIGRGFDKTREQLGENTGVIKLVAFESGARVSAINTLHMFKNLGVNHRKIARAEKKTITCIKMKEAFPEQLEDRRVSKSGKFTHEADAIGFIVSFCIDYDINIDSEGIQNDSSE